MTQSKISTRESSVATEVLYKNLMIGEIKKEDRGDGENNFICFYPGGTHFQHKHCSTKKQATDVIVEEFLERVDNKKADLYYDHPENQ